MKLILICNCVVLNVIFLTLGRLALFIAEVVPMAMAMAMGFLNCMCKSSQSMAK